MVTRSGSIGAVVVAVIVMAVLAVQMPAATRASQTTSDENAMTVSRDLTVHEWGTFTTVAGEDGRAVEWLPLGGPIDLPCFVYSFNRTLKFGLPDGGAVPDYATARNTLRGKVRMETPVLYFYATRPATVDVSVRFDKGLFSEWYPDAVVNLPAGYPFNSRIPFGMTEEAARASIFWKDVRIMPDADPSFPVDQRPSHYYAARATDATPISYKGEREKFLFYRGIAAFDPPIVATVVDNGTVTLANRSGADVPHVLIFARHGSRHGFSVQGRLSADQEVNVVLPSAERPLDDVMQELEQTLVAQGLFVKEAQAMIATWRDSWFEDDTRLFYIVPPAMVDRVLPLDVDPKPASIARVFVGRVELITSSEINVVAKALDEKDHDVLERYGRLLGPIGDRVLAKTSEPEARAEMRAQLNDRLKAIAARVTECGQTRMPETTAALMQVLSTAAAPVP